MMAAVVDELIMLVAAVAVAAVVLVALFIGLYVWVLRRRAEQDEARVEPPASRRGEPPDPLADEDAEEDP